MEQNTTLHYFKLRKELEKLPGYFIILDNNCLYNSIYVFDRNFQDLIETLNFMEQDPRSRQAFSIRGRPTLETIDCELIRKLHNFVAAATSLIDHTRRIYKKYYGKANNFPEYKQMIQSVFAKDQISQFVQDLRNYCLHYKVPTFIYVVSYERKLQQEIRKVALQKNDLLTFDRWSTYAKDYINSLNKEIPLTDALVAYNNKVIAFYEWFQKRQFEIHETEIQQFRAKEAQMLLIQLEMQLNMILLNGESHHPDDPFMYIFSSEEMQNLAEIPLNSPNRAEFVIQLLENHLPVPDDIKQKVRQINQRRNIS